MSSGTALTLAVRGGRVIEQVDGVQSLDVGALLARLVGSVQERSSTRRTLRSRCLPSKTRSWVTASRRSRDGGGAAVLAKQNQELGHRVAALEVVAEQIYASGERSAPVCTDTGVYTNYSFLTPMCGTRTRAE